MSLPRRVLGRIRRSLSAATPETSARLDHHEAALRDITAALQALQAGVPLDARSRIDAVDAAMPRLLNTISSQEGLLRQNRRELNLLGDNDRKQSQAIVSLRDEQGELWSRFEMIRREVLFELRYSTGGGSSVAGATAPLEPKVVDAEKFDAAVAAGVRLNLGAGHVPLDGYVNVDMRELPGVDVVAGLDDLPVEAASVAEIFSSHVLEHFPAEQLDRQLLPYWTGLLAPGGVFRAVVPDGAAMLAGHAAGTVSFADLREVLYGGQEYEGDFHFDLFTPDTLKSSLEQAGLVDVEIEAEGRPNGICLEFQVSARKPA